MRIGTRQVSYDAMFERATAYATQHSATVLYYDLAGDPQGTPGPDVDNGSATQISLSDLGRLVVFNARLGANDVPALLEADLAGTWEPSVLPVDARLEDCLPGSQLEAAATAAYQRLRGLPGIGRAKRSKLLHLKRPWLVPVIDSRVDPLWAAAAAEAAREMGTVQPMQPMYWEAIRRDLVDGSRDLARLRSELASSDDELLRRLGRLTELRLLDVVAWTTASA
jgi:hypothetical protein